MDTVIRETNEGLLEILNDLENRRLASQKDLELVTSKINEKVDEAKEYKIEVDNAKGKIKVLEQEIEALEVDLTDLNERFGKKDLNAIVEAGNREINSKIMEKQNQITKYRQKIGELTERARSIKDLLINLKKDKTTKEEKLDTLTQAHDYYSDSLNKIIEYAKNNPNSLNSYEASYNNLSYDYTSEPLTGVFDEIESLDKEDSDEDESPKIKSKNISEDLGEDEESGLNNIFEKLRNKSFDFEEINKSIDEEYNNIFGSGDELEFTENKEEDNSLELSENDLNTPLEKPISNTFDESENLEEPEIPDIFGNNVEVQNTEENSSEVADFFSEYNLDFNQFTSENQDLIKNIFTKDHFHKIMEILKNNQLDLSKIFNSVDLLEKGIPEEIDQVITKLLLAGQTKHNIELVMNNLGSIKNVNLTEVINSYGPNIKDVSITDLIMKSQKLSGDPDFTETPKYLFDFDLTNDEITIMESKISRDVWEMIVSFPQIVIDNYNYLKNLGIGNIKEVFMGHPQMFVMNPDKFKAIFAKYDQNDLIRCLEKNAAVIEKL